MNRTLIGALDTVNNLLALAIILFSTAAGFAALKDGPGPLLGVVIGFVAGVIVAAVVCGVLAIFIEIEKHLRQLVAGQETGKINRVAGDSTGFAAN